MEPCAQTTKQWATERWLVELCGGGRAVTAFVTDRISGTVLPLAPSDIRVDGIHQALPSIKLAKVLANTHIVLSPCGNSFRLYVRQNGVGGMKQGEREQNICFSVGGKEIRCPLDCLLKNEFFRALLSGGMRESGANMVEIEETSYETFLSIISWLTHRQVPKNLSLTAWIDLADAADQYQVDSLYMICETHFLDRAREIVTSLCGIEPSRREGRASRPPLSLTVSQLLHLEEQLLSIQHFAVRLNKYYLQQVCEPVRRLSLFDRDATVGVVLLPNTGIHRVYQTTILCIEYHYSCAALGIALQKGYYELLPSLALPPVNHEVYQTRAKLQLSPIGCCFDADVIIGERTIWSTPPVETAICRGDVEGIRWLTENPAAQGFFKLSHLELAFSMRQFVIGQFILRALTRDMIPAGFVEDLLAQLYRDQDEGATEALLKEGKMGIYKSAPPDLFFTLIGEGDIKWLSLCWEALNLSPMTKDKEEEGMLHIAAKQGQAGVAKWFIEKGVEVNSTNSLGATALHIAAYGGHPNVVKQLIEANAQTDICDHEGRTAYRLAHEQMEKGTCTPAYLDVIRLLQSQD